jgi:hypothetical protein
MPTIKTFNKQRVTAFAVSKMAGRTGIAAFLD